MLNVRRCAILDFGQVALVSRDIAFGCIGKEMGNICFWVSRLLLYWLSSPHALLWL